MFNFDTITSILIRLYVLAFVFLIPCPVQIISFPLRIAC